MVTFDLGILRSLDKSLRQAWLAAPSTGGAVTFTRRASSWIPVISFFLDRGLTTIRKETPIDESVDFCERRVVLQAIKRTHVQDFLTLGRELGMNVDVIQSDCVALVNLAVHEYLDEAESDAVCLLGFIASAGT